MNENMTRRSRRRERLGKGQSAKNTVVVMFV
jgi:hypothetical protein